MSFNYNKNKGHEGHDSMWTSYSDLFMGLSFVFLLLYVTSSLRIGTDGIQQSMQMRKVTMENEDLKNQLKVYESLKKDYLEKQATPDDEKMYQDLIGKLDLLQDTAKKEKEDLQAAAQENAKKEMALNKYQQMVRNIVNANAVAKARIKKRNDVIQEQDTEIAEQDTKIGDLEQNIVDKKNQIAARERQIENMNDALDKKMKELRWSYKNQKMNQKKFEQQMTQARQEHNQRLAGLQQQQRQAQAQLQTINSQLAQTQGELNQKETQLAQTSGQLAQAENEKQNLKGQLVGAEKTYNEKLAAEQRAAADKLGAAERAAAERLAGAQAGFAAQAAKLRGEFEAQRGRDKAAFDAEMGKQKMGAAERAAKEAAFRAGVARKERELGDKIAGLQGALTGTQAQLAKAQADLEAKKSVAKEIKAAFAKAGVKAEVDDETGDVTLDFGQHYFDTGRAEIKPEMAKVLQKAIPVYSKSLMDNKRIAHRINALEIIGFASPTYQGRVVNPKSMNPEDKKAVEYNLDLSYQRARSIFQHVFDPNRMTFEHQKELRAMVKVSGKSFFEAAKINRDVASDSVAEFCRKYDCKKSQRVLIKFNLDPK